MTENEAIELHIAENLHRIEVIEEFLRTNLDADDKECRKNIQIFTKINGALQEIQQYRAIGTVEECREAMERQKTIKPIFEMNFGDCESKFSCECGKKMIVRHDRGVMDNHDGQNYCSNCGSPIFTSGYIFRSVQLLIFSCLSAFFSSIA